MNEWYLLLGFSLLLIIAALILTAPFRKNLFKCLLVLILLLLPIIAYQYWGNFSAWKVYAQAKNRQENARMLLANLAPEQLIEKLKMQLQAKPSSARGWYLLGRIYESQHQWQGAHDAFKKSWQLDSKSLQSMVHYTESLWQLNQHQFTPEIIDLWQKILAENPNQPDALTMLAMAAYARHDYPTAKKYWQQLLTMVPEHSEDARVLQRAIAKVE